MAITIQNLVAANNESAWDSAFGKIRGNWNAAQADTHVVIMAIFESLAVSGNYDHATNRLGKLDSAFPKGAKVNTLRQYMEFLGVSVSISKGTATYAIPRKDGVKHQDLIRSMQETLCSVKWYDFKKAKVEESFDFAEEFAAFMAKAMKRKAKGVNNDKFQPAFVEDALAIVAAIEAARDAAEA